MDIKFKGKAYVVDKQYWDKMFEKDALPCNKYSFQTSQWQYLIDTNNYSLLKLRLINQLKWGGVKKVK